MNISLFSNEETSAYYDVLLATLHDRTVDLRVSYFTIQSLLRSIITHCLRDERQFFTNDYARILFLADKYRFPEHLKEALQKNRSVFARIRKDGIIIQQRHLQYGAKAIVLLLRFFSTLPTPADLYSFAEQSILKRTESLFEDETIILERGYFNIINVVAFTKENRFPVHVNVLAENGTEWTIYLSHAFVEQTALFRQGVTIFCTALLRAQTKEPILLESENTLLVIEPDVLFDVTEIADCFSGKHPSIAHYIVKKLLVPTITSKEMFIGTIINYCFDILLTKADTSPIEAIRRACLYKPIMTLAALEEYDENALVQEISQQYSILQSLVHEWQKTEFTVEASFLSPMYGLQGRVDLLVEYTDDQQRKTVVELKSGKPPTAFNQRGNAAFGMWKNHEAQIMCYNLLVDSAFPGRIGDSSVLYSRDANTPLRNTPNTIESKRAVLAVRNAIVMAEQDILQKKFGVFSHINPEEFQDAPLFIRDKFVRAKAFLDGLSDTEKVYHRAAITFIMREHYAARLGSDKEEHDCGYSALWKKNLEEKIASFSAIRGLFLDKDHSDFETMHITFLIVNTHLSTSFRLGDIVIAYVAEENQSAVFGQLLKARIKEINDYSLVLSFRNKLLPRSLFLQNEYKEWIIEPDFMDSGNHVLFGLLTQFLISSPNKRHVFLGLSAPVNNNPVFFDIDICRATQPVLPPLTEEQYSIISRMIATRDYFLLQGPPGTGKTSVILKWCTYLFYEYNNATLVITAYTNRAVDEILRAVSQVIPREDIIRLGTKESTDYEEFTLDTISQGKTIQDIKTIIQKARCIIGTVSSLMTNYDIFALKQFDCMIVDEAAQIVEPTIVGFAAKVGTAILIGDEKQLPAVTVQHEALSKIQHPLMENIECTDFRMSLFERLLRCCLRNDWHHGFAMLSQQGRMHADIADFVNTQFYAKKLLSPFPWQHAPLMNEYNALPQEYTQSRMVFIPVYSLGKGKVHDDEARIAAYIASLYQQKRGDELHENSLGIITPFRAQIMEIRKRLTAAASHKIVIDTVERFQGSERDCIIISFAVSNVSMLQSVMSLMDMQGITVDRKLNVAITRARQQLIIIGNPDILCREPLFQQLLSVMEWINPESLSSNINSYH